LRRGEDDGAYEGAVILQPIEEVKSRRNMENFNEELNFSMNARDAL
jgi:hypothetical protein